MDVTEHPIRIHLASANPAEYDLASLDGVVLDSAIDVKADETVAFAREHGYVHVETDFDKDGRLSMPETHNKFSSDLRISMTPVIVALLILAVMLRVFAPEGLSGRSFSLLFSFIIAGVAALAQSLERRKSSLGRWFLICAIVVLLCVWGTWFDIAEILFLLIVPMVLAAALINLSAALIMTVGESVLLLAVMRFSPIFSLLSVRPVLIWVTLIVIWIIYALMVAIYQPVYHLAQWSWTYYQEGRTLSDKARSQKAELLQLVDDLTYANRQLALAQNRMIALRSIAEEAQQAKSSFVARVSHEFRSPLNIIIGMISLMVDAPELYGGTYPPQVMAHLRIVHRTCQHLSGMVDDVLDLSQTEVGRMILHYKQANLTEVLQAAIEFVQPLMKEKGLTCRVEIPSALPLVACDVVRIRQIVLNLLSNAVRLMTQGGITVRVEWEGPNLVLSVADTGPGIASEDVQRIFEPYYRGSGATVQWQDNQGSGLGLSISKQLVTLHGGEMWLESTLGIGTTFYIRLPFSPPEAPVAAPNRWIQEEWLWRERQTHPSFSNSHYKPRVVICDQVGGFYSALSHISDRVEFVDTRVLSQAFAELQQNTAQVLLLNASSISALWADASKAVYQAPDIPVIGCVCPAHIAQRLPAEVSGYLIKPITRDDLYTAIESVTHSVERLLIVDDDADTREMLSFYIKAYDVMIDIVVAENGEQALAVLHDTRPDLILLDLVMGEVDGWQVLDAKLRNPELTDIPVIIITAQDPTPEPLQSQVLLATMGGGIALEKVIDGAAILSVLMSGVG